MRALQLCVASMSLSLFAGCADEPNIEIWDIEPAPRMCDNGEDYYYFCAQYTVDGTDDLRTLSRDIDGLEQEWGHSYQVEVEIIEVESETESSSIRYELVELLDEEVHPGLEFEVRLERNVVAFDPDGVSGFINVTSTFACTLQQCSDLALLFSEFAFVDAVFRFGPDNQLFPLELVSFAADEG
jgi:hypothetical protein